VCAGEGGGIVLPHGVQEIFRLPLELVEIRPLGELMVGHMASMLSASGPQAGQHGNSRATVIQIREDSVLRVDPRAPQTHRGNLGV